MDNKIENEISDSVNQVVTYIFIKYLDRNPDPEGLEYYRKALLSGMSIVELINSISSSEEALQKQKDSHDIVIPARQANDIDAMVALSYRHYLQREPDEAGKQFYRAAIVDGMTLSELGEALSSSPEAKKKHKFFSPGNDNDGISDGAFIREIGYLLFENTVARPRDFEHYKAKLDEEPRNRMPLVQQLIAEQIVRRGLQKTPLLDTDSCWIMGTQEFLTRKSWDAKVADLEAPALTSPPKAQPQHVEQREFCHTGEYRVSAIASMYKGGKYLETFLENIVSQSIFDQSELIIVDACSPEGEEELISRYMKIYSNIVYKRFDYRIGIYDAWNYAAQIARGEYLTNTNLDDLRRQDSFEIQAAALDRHAFADVVYQDVYYSLDFRFDFESVSRCGFKSNLPIATVNNMLEFNSPHNAPMWRKRLHEEIGYFDPSYRSAGDYEFWLRCLKGRKTFLKTNTPHVVYYQNPDGISTASDTPGVQEARRAWRTHAEELMSPYFEKSRAEFAHDIGLVEVPGTEVSDYDMVQKRLQSFAAEARAGWPEARQTPQKA